VRRRKAEVGRQESGVGSRESGIIRWERIFGNEAGEERENSINLLNNKKTPPCGVFIFI
jgi:hypothetical protein